MTTAALPPSPGMPGWAGGAAVSVLAHGLVLGGLVLALLPVPFEEPTRAPTRVEVRSEPVQRGSADPVAPDAPQAPSAAPTGARTAAANAPDTTRAEALALPATPLPASAAPTARPASAAPPAVLEAAAPIQAPTQAAAPTPALIQTVAPPEAARPARPPAPSAPLVALADPMALAAAAPPPALPAGRLPVAPTLTASPAPSARMAETAAPPASFATAPAPAAAPSVDLSAVAMMPAAASPAETRAAPPPAPLPLSAPPAPAATALDLPSERQVAALVPESTGLLPAEALAAFLRPGDILPGDAGAVAVRDGIAAALAQFPCARIQSGFNPDSGALELRGHIPDPAMHPAVIDSLQAQLGAGVPVTGDLLILPRPQCQMLAALDALGLPQSSEQFTNPRVIGPDAHVRDYRFAEGDRLELDLTAPDYPAYILVDYFDAQGQVLHLQPNGFVPPRLAAPREKLTVGRAAPGQPALDITISPPFGQEIAVALAVSAPVLATGRPLVEPAAPYLAELAARLRAARAADPGFKGEWVYFFVSTAPRGNQAP